MPKGAINCTRPGRYGNPYRIGQTYNGFVVKDAKAACEAFASDVRFNDRYSGPPINVRLTTAEIRADLCGKDLICWCALDQPCHVDILLEISNADET